VGWVASKLAPTKAQSSFVIVPLPMYLNGVAPALTFDSST
jgi:hypothetical protein